MCGMEEPSIDQLSLVTQLTKYIIVKALGGRTPVSELGQFSPIFVWLLWVLNSKFFFSDIYLIFMDKIAAYYVKYIQ